ncbi:MAG: M23 family metallopeptidase [Candidatus Shapirobacteria bacterium]|nr:M23 family metallopeptidase [Candidatus Shapirobacteria bacterium]
MIKIINSLFEGKNHSSDVTPKKLKGDFLRLKNIRKGSRLSRMGRIIVQKFQTSFLAGLMIIGLSLGGFNNLPVLNNRPVEAAYNQTIPDEPVNIITHTETTAQLPLDTFQLTQRFHLFHPAIDLAAPVGTPIKAIAAGKVVIINRNNFGLGNYLVVKHGAQFYSVYAHLNEILVKKDQEISKEVIIGTVGNTGFSTGPHLHLEVIIDNQKINPLTVLPPLTK